MSEWEKLVFRSKPSLKEISSDAVILYVGQKYDEKYFKLEKEGWTHDHCDECFERIESSDEYYEKEGEINCVSCRLNSVKKEKSCI